MSAVDVFGRHRSEFRAIVNGASDTHKMLRDRVLSIIVATLVVDLVGTLLVLFFEQDAKGTQVRSFGTALFWTTSQLLTVSSSFQNPVTAGGQVVDVFLEIWAMLVVASLTGSFGSFMVHRGLERKQAKHHTG